VKRWRGGEVVERTWQGDGENG
jgi:hypothetical protein